MIYVKDTGTGIAKDRQEAIFEHFVQADLNMTRSREGSVLGCILLKCILPC